MEYGFRLSGRDVDLVVATERLKRQLRVFRVDPVERRVVDLGGLPILDAQPGEAGAPMGIGLYRRDRDGAIFAIVSPKTGPRADYLWQYQLTDADSLAGLTVRPGEQSEQFAANTSIVQSRPAKSLGISRIRL